MSYSLELKKRVKLLRRRGGSINAIARQVGIAKSTISLWVHDVSLPKRILRHLRDNSIKGRERALAIIQARYKERDLGYRKAGEEIAHKMFKKIDNDFWRICVALLFWCEGGKRSLGSGVNFMNSDPALMALFLHAFRSAFKLDEGRFSARIHLHEYHNAKRQSHFWSGVTAIPLDQFNKPYIKPHTKIRKRDGYPGCLSVRYGNAALARTLDAIYHALGEKYGPVG